jgi:hypothetical protein
LPEAMAKPEPCQVRINTCSPCTRHAEVEILGVAMCGPCAREQEAYFAIGELTQRTRGLRNKALADALKKIRRERVGRREGIAA